MGVILRHPSSAAFCGLRSPVSSLSSPCCRPLVWGPLKCVPLMFLTHCLASSFLKPHSLLADIRGLGKGGLVPRNLLGAFPIQEEVAMEAALTSVPIAVVLAVHTHSFIFTRTFCYPGFNLANKGAEKHGPALLPQTQGSRPHPPPSDS